MAHPARQSTQVDFVWSLQRIHSPVAVVRFDQGPWMMIRRIAFLPLLFATRILTAQEPLQPYDASGRYRTGGVEAQVTGALGDGRDVLLSWGALVVGGAGGRWMQRTELVAGVHADENLLDRVMAGPWFSVAVAAPGWYTELDRATRAEPYLLLGGGAFGVASLADDDDDPAFGISPGISAGIGFRLLDDAWDISLTQLEVLVRQRFGAADQGPQVYVRLSRALPRRRPPRAADPHPDGPAPLPPAPPRR